MYKLLYEIPVFFTSSDGELSDNNSRSKQHLNPPISLNMKYNNYMAVQQASLTYVTPNISAALGNNVWEFNKDGIHTYTFPDGLYNLDEINSNMQEFIQNDLTTGVLVPDLFVFKGDNANQKVSLQINDVAVSVNFANATLGGMLGFTSNITSTVNIGDWFESDNPALLNTITEFLLHSNIATGSYSNGNIGDVVCGILINSNPGEIINYEPFHPYNNRVNGSTIDEIVFYLTDQNNNTIDLRNEVFTVNFVIKVYE